MIASRFVLAFRGRVATPLLLTTHPHSITMDLDWFALLDASAFLLFFVRSFLYTYFALSLEEFIQTHSLQLLLHEPYHVKHVTSVIYFFLGLLLLIFFYSISFLNL